MVTVGQLAVTDLLDQNMYANSARTQFLNLAFVNDLAYDFPQDAHGYSRGILVDYVTPPFAARLASFQAPAEPGGPLSWDLLHHRADALELTWSPRLPALVRRRMALRAIAWRNEGRMARYDDALRTAGGGTPDLAMARRVRARWGAGLNLEIPLAHEATTGVFARMGVAGQRRDPVLRGVRCDGERWRAGLGEGMGAR